MTLTRRTKLLAGTAVAAAAFLGTGGTAGASEQPVPMNPPFSWVFVNTPVQSTTPPINIALPSCGSPSWGNLGGGVSLFTGSQAVYGAPPGVSPSYDCIGIAFTL